MAQLANALKAWGDRSFAPVLKQEIESLGADALRLDRGASQTGHIDEGSISITMLNAAEDRHRIRARIGVFFDEILAGCSCGDDPATTSAYCELGVTIDKTTAEADFTLLPDGE
ncbi:MAG: glucosamine--fructose-6-phosphate aminotransferase [Gammaproteobacteria bacterium RIFOXYA12_FULL_61_12]|nr:MAG: glucosamine--fructose-6-phosphate aminotransferase [Gammaproteobacteria bacterium RIFOXYD12_FULL_61_37]OGT93228.1 MAG: glucosamine--fructose-6-phosphate aminotransferase [Gammaproteobacteria bacterium RIFOXYA12_FULL_61_12]